MDDVSCCDGIFFFEGVLKLIASSTSVYRDVVEEVREPVLEPEL